MTSASASFTGTWHSAAEEIQLLYNPETLKPSICWVWFSVKPPSGFGPHRCAFSPQWIAPAMNYRLHNRWHLAECLDRQNTHPTWKSNQMYRHHMDICHFMHVWYMYVLMCINTDVITQEFSNLWSWTAQKCLGLKVCFLVIWPASASSQEFIHKCLLFHVYVATHKTTRNVGQTQTEMIQTIARTHARQQSPRRQAGLFVGSPKKSPIGKSGTPTIFICHKRQKQSVRVNRNQLVSETENWIIGCQEIAGHRHRCAGLQMSLQGLYLLHAGKWMVNLEGIDSFPENLSLSALICAILGERRCFSYYLGDIWDLHIFNLCQISSEHRFDYESRSFSFLCLSATGCYMNWALSSLLTSLL